jgi:hypothetical protein
MSRVGRLKDHPARRAALADEFAAQVGYARRMTLQA